MADSKIRQSSGRRMLMLCLLAGAFCVANVLSGGNAGGQPPKDQVPPLVVPPTVDSTQKIQSSMKSGGRRLMLWFTINPDASLKELLPIPPKAGAVAPRLIDDISQVPEVAFQEPLAKSPEALKLTAHTIAKINH